MESHSIKIFIIYLISKKLTAVKLQITYFLPLIDDGYLLLFNSFTSIKTGINSYNLQ